MTPWVLYGMPGSLYTARARSYLRKQGLPLEERAPGDPRFAAEVLPRIGRWIVPVVQTPTGELVQDGAANIDHGEDEGLAVRSAHPVDPAARVVAHLFDLFGGEGLLRPAMHYRWNFDADNLAFLRRDFVRSLNPAADAETGDGVFAFASDRMRQAMRSFGVTPGSIPTVEASYLDFLRRLDAHLEIYPYLLGDAPSLGDYGLIAPLHAHLSRDPHPSALMKRHGPNVWRWVERMTTRDDDAGEYLALPPPAVPVLESASLARLLAFVAEDYLPELAAMVGWLNAWLAVQDGSALDHKPIPRIVGHMDLIWRGHALSVAVMPYRLWLLQKVQAAAAALNDAERARLRTLFEPAGRWPLLDLKTHRPVVRRDHREWWG